MEDRTVILTILDGTWGSPGSVLDLFLESFRIGQKTQRFLNHLVVAALDNQTYRYCTSIHPHCFQLTPVTSKLAKRKGSTSPDHLMLKKIKYDLLLEVIKLGYNIVFTEADVMWLRDPFVLFDPGARVTISCALRGTKIQDKGLLYMKSSAEAIKFLKFLQFKRVLFPTYLDRSFCEMAVHKLQGHTKYVDTGYFGGFCEPSNNISKVYTMQSTCCDNIKSKVHDLRLVLDDWINFTARMSTNAKFRIQRAVASAEQRIDARQDSHTDDHS
ncbi:uncharacterized protein At4g15970-like [Quercus robur]|uniref:uncharacterized protein At4g15970-like n=1 Tax=Quercus robur TaxID=38942 RepID=UPI002161763E|nr:uncharacterized protein At4g15970-like [Quercus robur]